MPTPDEQKALDDKAAEEAAAKEKDEKGGGDDLTERLMSEVTKSNERIADTVKEALERAPAPVAAAPGETPEAKYAADRAAYEERVTAAEKEFQELAAAGKYDEGAKALRKAYGTAPALPQADITKTPYFQSLTEGAMARARADAGNKEVFEKWGDEVQARLMELSDEKRLTDAGVNEAIAHVKSLHINDILEAHKEKIREEFIANPAMVQNAAETGPDGEDLTHGLDNDERMVAKSFGTKPEDYAAMAKVKPNRDGSVNILPDLQEGDTIQPGRF